MQPQPILKLAPSLTLCLVLVTTSTPSFATVESLSSANIAIMDPQSEQLRIVSVPFFDNYSSMVEVAMAMASFRPLLAWAHGIPEEAPLAPNEATFQGNRMMNLNVLFEQGMIFEPDYNFIGDYDSGIVEMKGVLNVTELVQKTGLTNEERIRTSLRIKAAMVALTKNLEDIVTSPHAYFKGFKAHLEVQGLANLNQNDLPGQKILAKTNYPYSIGSPVLSGFKADLNKNPYEHLQDMANGGNGKADSLGTIPSTSEAGGCTYAPDGRSDGPAALFVILSLLGLAIVSRRR